MTEPKPSFLRRAGRYGADRLRPESVRDASRTSLRGGKAAALKALRPKPFDPEDLKGGLQGRYEDGGKARFAEMVAEQGLSDDDLRAIEASHRAFFRIFSAVATAFLVLACAMIILGSGFLSFAGAAVLALFSLATAIGALKSSFAAYQTRQRAFCSLSDYLSHKE